MRVHVLRICPQYNYRLRAGDCSFVYIIEGGVRAFYKKFHVPPLPILADITEFAVSYALENCLQVHSTIFLDDRPVLVAT